MSANLSNIKGRIRSIQSTRKTTKAMELIANAKLAKAKKDSGQSKAYTDALIQMSNIILSGLEEDCIYTQADNTLPKANVVFVSDMGLCGGYNSNMLKFVCESIDHNEPIFIIGKHEYAHFKQEFDHLLNEVTPSDNCTFEYIKDIAMQVLTLYTSKKVGGIRVFYTQFINTLTFKETMVTLLPLEVNENNVDSKVIFDFEPDGLALAHTIVPMMVTSNLWEYYKESKLSEYASRRAAMESANRNAGDMIDALTLQYNQARQSAITTQITEIVAGANAL